MWRYELGWTASDSYLLMSYALGILISSILLLETHVIVVEVSGCSVKLADWFFIPWRIKKKSESAVVSNTSQFLKEHCFLEGSQALPVCPSSTSNMYMKTNVERWWNDTDRRKLKCSEGGNNLSQCHFIHHSSHMDWPGIKLGPVQWNCRNWLLKPWCCQMEKWSESTLYIKIHFIPHGEHSVISSERSVGKWQLV